MSKKSRKRQGASSNTKEKNRRKERIKRRKNIIFNRTRAGKALRTLIDALKAGSYYESGKPFQVESIYPILEKVTFDISRFKPSPKIVINGETWTWYSYRYLPMRYLTPPPKFGYFNNL